MTDKFTSNAKYSIEHQIRFLVQNFTKKDKKIKIRLIILSAISEGEIAAFHEFRNIHHYIF